MKWKWPEVSTLVQLARDTALTLAMLGAAASVSRSEPTAAQVKYLKPGGGGQLDGSTWIDAYPTVEDAVNGMTSGDSLLIKEGTYTPTSSLGFAITKHVYFYGGCAGDESSPNGRHGNPTIFDGVGTKKHVVNISSVVGTPGVLLDSIEIRGGDANTALQNVGGGVYSLASDLDMTDCLVYNNHADQDGGGLYFDGGAEDARTLNLKRCEFTGNLAGTGSDTGSVGRGGGMYVTWGKGYAVACTYSKNKATLEGGAACLWRLQPAQEFQFHENTFWANQTTHFQNSRAGAIMCGFGGTAGQVQVMSCSLAGNYAATCVAGQAIYYEAGVTLKFSNTIAFFNYQTGCSAAPLAQGGTTPYSIDYCDIEGFLGPTNISQDPMFTSVATGRLRLKKPSTGSPGSPCIDIGGHSFLPTDVLDLDDDGITAGKLPVDIQGVRRVSPVGGTALDMGAYEVQ